LGGIENVAADVVAIQPDVETALNGTPVLVQLVQMRLIDMGFCHRIH
jgi:hypothetical protein